MDIVERLRDTTGIHEELIYEAADEIERLREVEAVAIKALREIWDGYSTGEREKEAVARMALDEIAALQQKESE